MRNQITPVNRYTTGGLGGFWILVRFLRHSDLKQYITLNCFCHIDLLAHLQLLDFDVTDVFDEVQRWQAILELRLQRASLQSHLV